MKPRDCAPHSLQPWLNCLSYRDWPDLRQQLDVLDQDSVRYQQLLQASRTWVLQHTTTALAQRLLDAVAGR